MAAILLLTEPSCLNTYSHKYKSISKLVFLIVNSGFRGVRKEGPLLGFVEFYQLCEAKMNYFCWWGIQIDQSQLSLRNENHVVLSDSVSLTVHLE